MALRKVLISQPEPDGTRSPYSVLENKDLELRFQPFIKVERLSNLEFREQKINLLTYTAIIFNTKTAMEHFFGMCEDLRLTIPDTMKYFCMSEQIALYLSRFTAFKKRRVFYPTKSNLDEFVQLIAKYPKEEFFMPVTEAYKRDFLDKLEDNSVACKAGVMFRTVPVVLSEELRQEVFDLIVLFTPMGVKALQDNFPNIDPKVTKLGASGPKTAQALEEMGYELEFVVPNPQSPSVPSALQKCLKARK